MRKVKFTGSVWAKVAVEFEMEIADEIDICQDGDVIRDMIMDYDGDFEVDVDQIKDAVDCNWVDMEDIDVDEIL